MDSLRKQVMDLLDKNPLLTAINICKILKLDYDYYKAYIYNIKSDWKYSLQKQGGSTPLVHGWRGWTYIPSQYFDDKHHMALRIKAVNSGWIQSKARNRFLYYKDRIGRLEWFETKRINIYVRKPLTTSRAYQLVCNAFSHLDLITDLKVLQVMLQGIKFKQAHYVFDTPQRLPQLRIDLFDKSNGIRIMIGDRSHPHAVEVIAKYPDWAERNEKLFENMNKFFENMAVPVDSIKKPKWYIA